ncbi:kinase-like protein [Lophium mytilinum]|uniref:Kinase-like protein n=1 Tax=Lophium mytilinum TaxID=390894 RepID=A0A6A6Q9B5_9PEZI|nr:kinase-like protein [Lophium mytilinum]
MTSRTLTNVVNEQTITFNALIYGYAGHSLVTPHSVLQQVWWTDEKIDATVTKEFVTSRLRPNERDRLEQPVAFGDGLTDDTYIEWILEKAKRLFLTLVESGVPDQIFPVIDHSWEDDDLPLPLEEVERLALSYERNDQLNYKFHNTQFTYLLRELTEGAHFDYAPNEVLPLEYVHSLPPAVALQNWSRVHLPKKPNDVFVRRKISLGGAVMDEDLEMDFHNDVEASRLVEHDHIAPVWASYTSKGNAYVLTNFVGQHTLKSFIDHRKPAQYQRLQKKDRYQLLLGWLHCLADAITSLHQNGLYHGAIRPSNILIDESNAVAFSDIGSLGSFQKDKRPDPQEAYNYGSPEANSSARPLLTDQALKKVDSSQSRKQSISSHGSSAGQSVSSSSSRAHGKTKLTRTTTNNSLSGFDFGFTMSRRTKTTPTLLPATEKSDVFALGCVYLDILTFLLKKKAHDFTKHRSSKKKVGESGRTGNSRTDSSFHGNIDKVRAWMKVLEDTAFEHDDDAFRSIPHILDLVRAMLSQNPGLRPTARDVRDRLFGILVNYSGIMDVHCGAHSHDILVRASTIDSDAASTVASLRTSNSGSDSASSSVRVSSMTNSTLRDSSITESSTLFDDSASIRTINAEPLKIAISPSKTLPPPPTAHVASPTPKRFNPWHRVSSRVS